jgi:hypothetical protein
MKFCQSYINPLTPNDLYISRTTAQTSRRCTLYIYSTNIGTEYFKHALYSPFFFSSKCSLFHSANLFGPCIIHILYTGCAEIKKKKFRRQRVKPPYQGRNTVLHKNVQILLCNSLVNTNTCTTSTSQVKIY